MNTKKAIIVLIIVVVLAGAGYYLYSAKFSTAAKAKEAAADAAEDKLTIAEKVEQEIVSLVNSISEKDKSDMYTLASLAYEDMKGLNYHTILIFDKIAKLSNNLFIYFVSMAYPSFDSKSLKIRINMQNWKKQNLASRNLGYTDEKAVAIAANIIMRIDSLNL